MLIGVLDPNDLDRMSPTPANSSTARTGPPAIIPVPAEAGLIRIYQHQIDQLLSVECSTPNDRNFN